MSMEFKEFVNCTNINGKVIVPDDANIKSKVFLLQFSKELSMSSIMNAIKDIDIDVKVCAYPNQEELLK